MKNTVIFDLDGTLANIDARRLKAGSPSGKTPTPSKTSPKGGKRGCLCKDNTYNSKCCNGDLQNQGIGSTTGQNG